MSTNLAEIFSSILFWTGWGAQALKELDLFTLHRKQSWELSLSATEEHDNSWKVVSADVEVEGDLLVQIFVGRHEDLLKLNAQHVLATSRAAEPAR